MTLQEFRASCVRQKLIRRGDHIVVAVSGGPDSVCLLFLLAALRTSLRITLTVAHVNYGLRGKDSDRDEKLVRAFAKTLDVPCVVKCVHLKKNTQSENLEKRLRDIRYRFFTSVQSRVHADAIATAHTASDTLETFFLFLFRGASLTGLKGITPRRDQIIRPLLPFSRDDILVYLREHHIRYRTDRSNRDLSFRRNRVRHELIPYLKKHFNPSLATTIVRNLELARDDADFIATRARRTRASHAGMRFPARWFGQLHSTLQRSIIRSIFEDTVGDTVELTASHIEEIRSVITGSAGKKEKTFRGLKFQKVGGMIAITTNN